MNNGKIRLVFPVLFVAYGFPVAAAGEPEQPEVVRVCSECHGAEGKAPIPGWPPIAGMGKEELISKLKGYRAKLVPESRMSDVTHNFTDSEIEAIAQYYVELKPTGKASK